MDAKRGRELEELVLLSQAMLARAGEHQWEAVAELELRRRDLVLRFFEHAADEQDAAELAAGIKRILSLNERIGELVQQFQGQLGNEIHAQKAGRAATAAYLGFSR